MIDLYCERTTDGFFAEPLNILSNLAFFVSAVMAWHSARQVKSTRPSYLLMPGLMATTGIGSLYFHIAADGISQALDVGFLLLYQIAYLWFFIARFRPGNLPLRWFLIAAFVGAVYLAGGFPHSLNGSLLYLPTWIVLAGMIFLLRFDKTRAVLAFNAMLLFSLSLLFRTIDNQVCGMMPGGTHFLWHLLNALVMLMMFRLLLPANRAHGG